VKLSEIVEFLGLELSGEDREISNLATLKEADASSLSFFHDEKYKEQLSSTKAVAVLLDEKFAPLLPEGVEAIITNEPYRAMAKATALFAYKPSVEEFEPKLADGAKVAKSVRCGKNVQIGKNAVVMSGVYLGDNGLEIIVLSIQM